MSLQVWKALGGFHHQVIRKLTGQMSQQTGDSNWTYPPLGEAIAEAVIQEIYTYIIRR